MADRDLRGLLKLKVHDAMLNRECRQEIESTNGAPNIWIFVTSARVLHVAIWRSNEFPKESEWDAVMRAMPRDVMPRHAPNPRQVPQRYRKMLYASWRLARPAFGGQEDTSPTQPQVRQ